MTQNAWVHRTGSVRHDSSTAGSVITTAGVSAGIDMASHLIARLHSAQRARQVRRSIHYDPAPPV